MPFHARFKHCTIRPRDMCTSHCMTPLGKIECAKHIPLNILTYVFDEITVYNIIIAILKQLLI